MNKLKELNTTQDVVKDILTHSPEARNSDMLLYVMVCRRLNSSILDLPFAMVLTSLKELGLPNIETVRRTRQKLQATYPELASCDAVAGQRMLNEEDYRNYARKVNV